MSDLTKYNELYFSNFCSVKSFAKHSGYLIDIHKELHSEAFRVLTLWRQNFFFLILAHSVYKMWITQEPKKGRIMK